MDSFFVFIYFKLITGAEAKHVKITINEHILELRRNFFLFMDWIEFVESEFSFIPKSTDRSLSGIFSLINQNFNVNIC